MTLRASLHPAANAHAGLGLVIGGAVVAGAGVVTLFGGAFLLAFAAFPFTPSDQQRASADDVIGVGIAMVLTGAAVIAAGFAMRGSSTPSVAVVSTPPPIRPRSSIEQETAVRAISGMALSAPIVRVTF